MTYFPKPQPCGAPGAAVIMGISAAALLTGVSAATAGSKMYPMDDPKIIEAPGPIQPQPSAPDRYDWNGYYAGVSLAAIIHRGRIFAWVRTVGGVHDLHAQPEFSPQG